MLSNSIKTIIDEGSTRLPTNCRILDEEMHGPASIRTVRKKKACRFLKAQGDNSQLLESGAISLTENDG
jgi:hypothetical protein